MNGDDTWAGIVFRNQRDFGKHGRALETKNSYSFWNKSYVNTVLWIKLETEILFKKKEGGEKTVIIYSLDSAIK